MQCKNSRLLCLLMFAFFTRHVEMATSEDYFRIGTNTNTGEARQFLIEYDREASSMCYRVTQSQWKFVTNITDYNRRRMMEELNISSKFEKLSWRKAAAFDGSRLPDPQGRRQLAKIVQGSRAALPDDKFSELQQIITEMKEIYNSAKICPYGQKSLDSTFQQQNQQPFYENLDSFNQRERTEFGQNYAPTYGQSGQNNAQFGRENSELPSYCDMQLDPEISRILAHSRIESELLYVWKNFRDQTGPKLKNRFMRYVQLVNQAAVSTGFSDAGDQMRAAYEDPSFKASVEEIYNQIAPLYKQLFTYVRKKLIQRYGERAIRPDGPLPSHLLGLGNAICLTKMNNTLKPVFTNSCEFKVRAPTCQVYIEFDSLEHGFQLTIIVSEYGLKYLCLAGNMWAQNWKSIMDLVMPYPQAPNIDVTSEMLRQGFTPLRMFQMADEFYTSMGLKPAPPEFWRSSMLARPSDRTVQCTASAWDFCNRIDYRIKQCTEVTMQDLISTHHEMAHIQYYLQYSEQPQLFRDGANPAFHEAVANAATLSVYNIQHLQRVGLYNNRTHDPYEVSMNFLMTMALEKVAYLPFAFMVDQWRWSVFEDGVANMNARWWQMKLRYQGVVPPLPRNEGHFDPAAKYHVVSDQEYIKYFLATVLEFQIFEQLCQASGHSSHLHECDVYRSRDAGRLLSEMMQPGSSKTASDIIRSMTRGRTNRISPEALVKYFRPLELWLRVQNRDEPLIGWNSNDQDIGLFSPQRGSSETVRPLLLCYLLTLKMLFLFL